MKKQKILISLILLTILVFTVGQASLFSDDPPIDVDEVINIIDENFTFETDFYALISFTQSIPDDNEPDGIRVEVKEGEQYRRDRESKFLFVFTEPESERGKGYLYMDDTLLFYDANSREFINKTISESIGDTEAKQRDLEKSSLEEDYEFKYVGEGNVGKIECYIISGEAKKEDITAYPISKTWIRKDNYMPIKREEYALNADKPSQVIYYVTYEYIEEKYIATKTIILNKKEKGKKTIMEMSNISLDKISDVVFTKDYLESRSN